MALAPISHTRRIRGFKYLGWAGLLHQAIDMSMTMTFGAGGMSISPTFSYSNRVDDQKAPAFRIVALLGAFSRAFRRSRLSHIRNPKGSIRSRRLYRQIQKCDEFVAACMSEIPKLFHSGRASLTDVNRDNQSLLHVLAGVVGNPLRYSRADSN